MGLGLRLKDILRSKGMTIKQLSEISGVSINTLYSITKRDSLRADPVIMQKIADALLVPAVVLYEDEDLINENNRYANNFANLWATLKTINDDENTPFAIKKLISDNFPNFDNTMDSACAFSDALLQVSRGTTFLGDLGIGYTKDEIMLLFYARTLNENGMKVALDFIRALAANPGYTQHRSSITDTP